MFWSFFDKVDTFRQFIILQPNFRNKFSLKLNLLKNVFNKCWCPQLIFFNKKKFRKIQTIFDIEK